MEDRRSSILYLLSSILDLLIVSQQTQTAAHPLPWSSCVVGIRGDDRPRAVLGDDERLGQLVDILLDIRELLRKGRLVFIGRLGGAAPKAALRGAARGRMIEVEH